MSRPMKHASPGETCCSFCGTPGDEVGQMAGGLGAMICDKCVAYHHSVLTDPYRFNKATDPPWMRMTEVELLAQLPRIERTGTQANDFLAEWVLFCRNRGLSWTQIGAALGTTKQTAWEKFHRRIEAIKGQSDTEAPTARSDRYDGTVPKARPESEDAIPIARAQQG